MLGERLRVRLCAELAQEPGRALDVGEEEGDGAGREIGLARRDHPPAGIPRPVAYRSGEGELPVRERTVAREASQG